jgi:hypothetical protein
MKCLKCALPGSGCQAEYRRGDQGEALLPVKGGYAKYFDRAVHRRPSPNSFPAGLLHHHSNTRTSAHIIFHQTQGMLVNQNVSP